MRDGDEWVEIGIGNISSTGLMAKSALSLQTGQVIEIRRRGIVITGEIVWISATRFGLRSFEPIDVEALTAVSDLNSNVARTQPPPRQKLWHWRQSV